MKLYDCRPAGNPRRVRIFLSEKGIDIPKVEVNVAKGENLLPEYLRINPRGLVPVLELDDGTLIDETIAICRYFEEIQPGPPLLGTTPREKAMVESWQRHVEFDGMLPAQDIFRNTSPVFVGRAIPGVKAVQTIPELVDRGAVSIARFYARLEERLQNIEFIALPQFSIADITGMCAVDFAVQIGFPIPPEHSAVLRWHAIVSARPSAKA